jgi:hypothetical protein
VICEENRRVWSPPPEIVYIFNAQLMTAFLEFSGASIRVTSLKLTEVYKLAIALTSLVAMLVALLKLAEVYKLAVLSYIYSVL